MKRIVLALRTDRGNGRDLAGYNIDVMVIQCSTGEQGAVGVEGCAGDGRGAIMVEKAGVRLKGGEIGAVHVESLDLVAVGSPR